MPNIFYKFLFVLSYVLKISFFSYSQETDSLEYFLYNKDFISAIKYTKNELDDVQQRNIKNYEYENSLLNLLGTLYFRVNDYKNAEVNLISLLRNKRKKKKADNQYFKVINELQNLYSSKGDSVSEINLLKNNSDFLFLNSGLNSNKYISNIMEIGRFYFLHKNYIKAENYFFNAKSILSKINSNKENIETKSLLYVYIANLYSSKRNVLLAESYYLKYFNICKTLYEKTNPERYYTALSILGMFYENKKDLNKSIYFHKKSLPILYKLVNKESNVIKYRNDAIEYKELLSTTFFTISYNYFQLFKYDSAIKFEKECLNLLKKKDNKELDYYRNLNYLAKLYTSIGDYENSEILNNEYLNYVKINDIQTFPIALNNIAVLYLNIKNYELAEKYHLKALEINKEKNDKNAIAISLNNIGQLYLEKNDYNKAEKYFYDSYNISSKLLDDNLPVVLNNLGSMFHNLKNYAKAEDYYLKSIKFYKQSNKIDYEEYVSELINLGKLYTDQAKLPLAENYLKEAAEINTSKLNNNQIKSRLICNNFGALYHLMKRDSIAIDYLNTALKISDSIFGKNSYEYAIALSNIGSIYYDKGDYKMAEKYMLQSYKINPILDKEIQTSNLGNLYFSMGNIKESINYFDSALVSFNKRVDNIAMFLTDADLSFYLKNVKTHYDILKSLLFIYPSETKFYVNRFYNIELKYKGFILKNTITKDGNKIFDKEIEKIKFHKKILSGLLLNSKSINSKEIIIQSNIISELEKKIYKQNNINKLTTTWKDIQDKLSQNEVAIEFTNFRIYNKKWTDSTVYCALIIKKDFKQPKLVYLFEEKSLIKLLKKSNININSTFYNDLYQFEQNGSKLYKLVLSPLDEYLKNIKNIYFSSTGLLNNLNIAKLPINKDSTFDDLFHLHNFTSTSELIDYKNASFNYRNIKNAYVFGGINYDFTNNTYNKAFLKTDSTIISRDSENEYWSYLPGTFSELNYIDSICKINGIKTTAFSDINGTETNFKLLSNNNLENLIHLSTHAFFKETKTDSKTKDNFEISKITDSKNIYLTNSGIIFAGVNLNNIEVNTEDDGILTSLEISDQKLSKTSLIILSACETGLGQIDNLEGVYGLQRAFKLAGVKNIIMSLWKVPDNQTKELMSLLYKNIFSGKSLLNSLQEAQKEMSKKYSPYYWAAFKLLE